MTVRVSCSDQKGDTTNYIIICCSPAYNGVYKYDAKRIGEYQIIPNGKRNCFVVPFKDLLFHSTLEDFIKKVPQAYDVIDSEQVEFCKRYRKNPKQNWMLRYKNEGLEPTNKNYVPSNNDEKVYFVVDEKGEHEFDIHTLTLEQIQQLDKYEENNRRLVNGIPVFETHMDALSWGYNDISNNLLVKYYSLENCNIYKLAKLEEIE